jgi:hypothetical protein
MVEDPAPAAAAMPMIWAATLAEFTAGKAPSMPPMLTARPVSPAMPAPAAPVLIVYWITQIHFSDRV